MKYKDDNAEMGVSTRETINPKNKKNKNKNQ